MIESDEWDVFNSIGKKTPGTDELSAVLEDLARKHLEASNKLEALNILIAQLETEIAHVFPEEAGERAMSTDSYEVLVSRSERWTWDKAALEKAFSQGELPDHIKRSLTVDKRKFLKLPTSDQEKLKFALPRKLDKPKVKVIPPV